MRYELHPFSGIEAAREWACGEIDGAAVAARGRFLTPGQESIYQAKYAEAMDFASNGAAGDDRAFPWLAAEALHTGVTLSEVAERIKRRGDQWSLIDGPWIEALRTAGKGKVERLDDIGEVVRATCIAVLALEDVRSKGG